MLLLYEIALDDVLRGFAKVDAEEKEEYKKRMLECVSHIQGDDGMRQTDGKRTPEIAVHVELISLTHGMESITSYAGTFSARNTTSSSPSSSSTLLSLFALHGLGRTGKSVNSLTLY